MKQLVKITLAAAVTMAANSAFATLPESCCYILNDENRLTKNAANSISYDFTGNGITDATASSLSGELVQFNNSLGIDDGSKSWFGSNDDLDIESNKGKKKTEVITVEFANTVAFKGFYVGAYQYRQKAYNWDGIYYKDSGTIELRGYNTAGQLVLNTSNTVADSIYQTFDKFINAATNVSKIELFATGNTSFTLAAVCYDEATEVPVPAAAWLFGSALASLAGLRRRK